MPRLINTILGKVKGTLNDLTFFYKNNVQFVKSRKKPHAKSWKNSVLAKNNRRQFANSHFFSKIITHEKEIYDLWKSANVKGSSPYFKVHSYNRTKCTHKGLTEKNVITPDSIPISVENLVMRKDTLSFSFKLFRKNNDYLSAPFSLFICAMLTNGIIPSNIDGVYADFLYKDITEEISEYTEVQITFNSRLSEFEIPNFKELYIFIAAAKKIDDSFEWSSTYTKMFDISAFNNKWYLDSEIK
ncbi:MAG: hypothetical protein WC644_09760 [Ignavibacteria bacterium]